jgi:hypothetical protein
MPIDGIGRKGAVAPPGVSPAPGPGVAKPGGSFELRAPDAARPAGTIEGAAPTPLEQLRAGAITPGQYVDLKVEQATAHLAVLPPAELEALKNNLRERIATDPALSELVRVATGAAPSPSREE